MTQPTPAGSHRRRGRRVLAVGVAAGVLLAGGVVGIGQTAWWGCHAGTTSGSSALPPELSSSPTTDQGRDLAAQIASAPGVDSLLHAASFDGDVRLAAGPEGDLLVSDNPYFAERDEFHDASLDLTTGETSWSRGQAGQSALPLVAGDAVITFAAVEGGLYRLSILDASDGSVQGCIDRERIDRAGIGRAAAAASPDGDAVVLATPTEQGSAVSAVGIEDRDTRWDTALPGTDGTVTWIGDTVVADRLDARDVFGTGQILWSDDDARDRASITGLDATTGAESWHWPHELSPGAAQEAGSTVPFVDGPDDVVVVSAITFEEDDHSSRFLGLDARTGEEVWSVDTASVPWSQGFGDTVLALAGDELFALDASSGEELWRVPVTGGASGPRPDAAQPWGDDVVVATADGIAQVDLATGEMTRTPVQDAWALRLTATSDALAVVKDDGSSPTELLIFSRQT